MAALLRRRGCLVALVVLLAVGLAAALALRWALNPDALRALAESRLSEAFGRPVTIRTMKLTFLPPGAEGSDIRIGSPATDGAPVGISLRALRIQPRLSTVFSSPVVIERVEVVRLALEIGRDAQGRWQLPLPPLHGGGTGAAGGSPVAVDVNEIRLRDGRITVTGGRGGGAGAAGAATVSAIDATCRTSGGEVEIDSLRAALGSSRLEGKGRLGPGGAKLSLAWTSLSPSDLPGAFALLGTRAPRGLAIEGEKPLTLELTVDRAGAVSATGRIAASRASLGSFALASLDAPLRYSSGRLALDPVIFSAYGGTHRGRITVVTAAEPPAWAVESRIEGVDVNRLVSGNSTAKGVIDGTGRGQLRLGGTATDPLLPTITGTVVTRVSDGVIHNFPILAAVNSALKIGAGGDRDLRFDRLSATWAVGGARATTADFLAESGELRVAAAGTLGLDTTLDFRGLLVFSKAKSDELVRRVRELGGLRNAQGEIAVPVTASGTVAAPAFAVDMAAILEKAAQDELMRRLKKGIERWIK